MKTREIERIIVPTKGHQRYRNRGVLFVFFAVLSATTATFIMASLSVQRLCDTAIETKEKANGSSDQYQDIRYTFVDGNLSKEYLAETAEKPKDATNTETAEPAPTEAAKHPHTIYLTFDDGPGNYTAKLLDILKKYNVKATFFVTCKGSDEMIAREFSEGHTVALHTCSHKYAEIYKNDDAYFKDLEKVSNRVYKITGVHPKLLRLPGGSSNTVSAKYSKGIMSRITKKLTKDGYIYFDWNVVSGDADGTKTADGIYKNVIDGINKKSEKTAAIVLQHDLKNYSVEAVEKIIKYGLENGYKFLPLDENSPTAHHRVNN